MLFWRRSQQCILSLRFKNRLKISVCLYCNGGSVSTPPAGVPKYKVVFMGSDSFSAPSLISLNNLFKAENVSVVVSNENNIIGKCAKKFQNHIYHWNDFKTVEFGERLKAEERNYDFSVVASFGYLIPVRVINRFPMGILNVHGSLLPRWRGASPVAHAIMKGDTETGVSIMKIAPHRFDIGPVLLKKAVPLDDHIRAPELLAALAELGAQALIEVVKDLPNFLQNPLIQDERLATLAPKLTPEMGDIDWSSMTAADVYRIFRALYGTHKIRSNFNDRRVDLDEIGMVEVLNTDSSGNSDKMTSQEGIEIKQCSDEFPRASKAGEIFYKNDILYIRCANCLDESTWISVKKLKVGTKWMNAKDFKNGYLSKGKLSSTTIPKFDSYCSHMPENKGILSS